MGGSRDPVERSADRSTDLYDVSTWERRSWFDSVAVLAYHGVRLGAKAVPVVIALLLLYYEFRAASVGNPTRIAGLILLSVVVAGAVAGYVYRLDVTSGEPLRLVVATVALGILSGPLAGVLNVGVPVAAIVLFGAVVATILDALGVSLSELGAAAVEPGNAGAIQGAGGPLETAVVAVVLALYFFLVVAPVEETLKLGAVRLFAYRSTDFDAVVDGAVYGALAGLGFATVENALYITRVVDAADVATMAEFSRVATRITTVRALAGPGHVLYSGLAGYYLGLAKFNREHAGPILMKGLLLAIFFHATYNTLVGIVPPAVAAQSAAIPQLGAYFAFVLVFDGVVAYVLYRKLTRYARAYRDADAGAADAAVDPELAEFDPPSR